MHSCSTSQMAMVRHKWCLVYAGMNPYVHAQRQHAAEVGAARLCSPSAGAICHAHVMLPLH